MSGPVPKRSDARRRRNKVDGLTVAPTLTDVVIPPSLPDGTHALAVDWYESLKQSGQSQFYEPSDWATARYVAEAMSRSLKAQRFSAQLFAAVMSSMTELLTTEGARRRARLELQREREGVGAEADPGVTALAEYRAMLRGRRGG